MSIVWLEKVITIYSGFLLTWLQPRQGILSWWYSQNERFEVQCHCSWSDLWCPSPVPTPIWPKCYILPGSGSKFWVLWCLWWVCAGFEVCRMLKEAPGKAQKWRLRPRNKHFVLSILRFIQIRSIESESLTFLDTSFLEFCGTWNPMQLEGSSMVIYRVHSI